MAERTELSQEEFAALDWKDALLVDMRDAYSAAYGMIPGAISIAQDRLTQEIPARCAGKRVVLYCARGQKSLEAAEALRETGVDAYSLEEGYTGWLMRQMQREQDENRCAQIEKSIRTTYHKRLFSAFAKAIRTYDLVREGDRIAVCISGGKDSMLMAKLFQELQRHHKFPFELVFLVMDPGYNEANRRVIEHNARLMGVPITVFETNIFDIVYEEEKNPCYLCARMRRGHLYSKAKELGCNKIALGHHYDDVIETILMGMLYGAQVQTMMPKLHSTNFPGMELIRPMYLIREADIKSWRDANDLRFIQCACHFTDTCTACDPDGRMVSKRMEIKRLIAELKKVNPAVEANIFRSMENVNLNTVISYKQNGVTHSFLDEYDARRDKTGE
ncbi:MAG: ATP-binding protein [Candidatus Aphodomonas sp.]|nr:ATP-binding protein [Candidatus Aphodomonas sp.]